MADGALAQVAREVIEIFHNCLDMVLGILPWVAVLEQEELISSRGPFWRPRTLLTPIGTRVSKVMKNRTKLYIPVFIVSYLSLKVNYFFRQCLFVPATSCGFLVN